MRDLSELYLRRSSPPPSAEAVRAFEAHFQVTLSADYLHFLSLANGGETLLDCTFDYMTRDGEFVQSPDQVGDLFSLTADRKDETEQGVWEYTPLLREVFEENNWTANISMHRPQWRKPLYLSRHGHNTVPRSHSLS